MLLAAATMPASTQFLQVPQILPHRTTRSRSKSRPRDVPREVYATKSTTEVVISPNRVGLRQHLPPASSSAKLDTARRPIVSRLSITPTKMSNKPPNPQPSSPTAIVPASPNPPLPSPRDSPRETPSLTFPEDSLAVRSSVEDLNGDLYTLEPCVTPPPEMPLRQKLIGSWKLESYIAYPTAESTIQRPTFPMTKYVTGMIMYTPDGYMSAQMLIPGQKSFKRGEGEEAQWAEAGKRFFAYCGPYYINNEGLEREEVLRHTFQCCNLPGWVGDLQVRTHRFEEDGQVLVLGSEEPTVIKVSAPIFKTKSLATFRAFSSYFWSRLQEFAIKRYA